MDFRIGKLSVYGHRIARGDNGSDPPWRGYCWGSDWPRYQCVKAPAYYFFELSWLCYFIDFYWHRKTERRSP